MVSEEIIKEAVLHEIEAIFPNIEMPPASELVFHNDDCHECEYLREDLEEYRGKEITGDVIRMVHQELSLFSATGWLWILPHYLKHCMSPEGEYNQDETQFLIYNLGPDIEYQPDTELRLSRMTGAQITCLIHFLEWCLSQEYWAEWHSDDIDRAINYLHEIERKAARS